MSRCIDADALIADCQLAQKQADRHGREFANAFYSGGGEVSTEWWCVEDMIENAPTIEPERKKGTWIEYDNSHCECPFCHEEWSYFDNEVECFNYCPNCGAEMTEKSEEPKRCDTCKHEKSRWFSRCADCSDYELWEGKDETGRTVTKKETPTTGRGGSRTLTGIHQDDPGHRQRHSSGFGNGMGKPVGGDSGR